MRKNVIIGGSTKCGTTSVFQYLSEHPQVCASLIKETRFFWTGDYDLPGQNLNGKEVLNYENFFSKCKDDQWMLEATPDYLYSSIVAEKIKKEITDCRFIFILRNPVERIYSWYRYSRQRGFIPQHFQPEDYLEQLKKEKKPNTPQHLRALEQGNYAKYLECYIELFGRKNILVIFYNALQNNPEALMFEICDFLNIDKTYFENFDFKVYNPSLNVKSSEDYLKYIGIKKKLRGYNNMLPQNLRRFFRKVLKPLDVLYLKNKTAEWKEIPLSSTNQKFIADYYEKDHALLEKILEKKTPW